MIYTEIKDLSSQKTCINGLFCCFHSSYLAKEVMLKQILIAIMNVLIDKMSILNTVMIPVVFESIITDLNVSSKRGHALVRII